MSSQQLPNHTCRALSSLQGMRSSLLLILRRRSALALIFLLPSILLCSFRSCQASLQAHSQLR